MITMMIAIVAVGVAVTDILHLRLVACLRSLHAGLRRHALSAAERKKTTTVDEQPTFTKKRETRPAWTCKEYTDRVKSALPRALLTPN